MTSGTATSFKSGNGIAIIISKDAVEEQGIEPGHVIEYDIRRCNIEKRAPRRGNNFHIKKETEEPKIKGGPNLAEADMIEAEKEGSVPSEPTPEQPEGSI